MSIRFSLLTAGLVLLSAASFTPRALAGEGGIAVGLGVNLDGDGNVTELVSSLAVGKTSAFGYAMSDSFGDLNAGAIGTGAALDVQAYTVGDSDFAETHISAGEESLANLGTAQANSLGTATGIQAGNVNLLNVTGY